jgi:UDP-glucose:(heptosyl)LPS alpha-1,3-glucosyltransferase
VRIALLTRRFDAAGGGTERDLIISARCLRAAGHDVTIYAEEIRGESDGWAVRRVGSIGPGRTLSMLRFAFASVPAARRAGTDLVLSFARAAGADILRSGGGAHSSYLRAARKWRGTLGSATMRLRPYHRVQLIIEREAFCSPELKHVIAVSNFVRDDLVYEFKLAPSILTTIYNGVDLARFTTASSAEERARVRGRFKLPPEARVVLFVGNGFGRKGLGFLVEAWPRLKSKAHLVVVGADRDLSRYQKRAAGLGVAERICFAGPQSNVEGIFRAADAFALPSLFEPFGNVVLEAMASGLPVMTSDFCGVAEILPPPMREFCLPDPTKIGEMAERLDALVNAAPKLRAEARATAEQFTWDRYARELDALIRAGAH